MDLGQDALPGRRPVEAAPGQGLHAQARQAATGELGRGVQGDRQGQAGQQHCRHRGRHGRLRNHVRRQDAAQGLRFVADRRPPDRHGLRRVEPGRGQFQFDLCGYRNRRCYPDRRQPHPLGSAAGQRADPQGGEARCQGLRGRSAVGHDLSGAVPRRGPRSARRIAQGGGRCLRRRRPPRHHHGRRGACQGRAGSRPRLCRNAQAGARGLERLQRAALQCSTDGRIDARFRAEGRDEGHRRGRAQGGDQPGRRRDGFRTLRRQPEGLYRPSRRQGRACGGHHPAGFELRREGRDLRQHRRPRAIRRTSCVRAG